MGTPCCMMRSTVRRRITGLPDPCESCVSRRRAARCSRGGPPRADLRGGPERVSDVWRAHAGRRVHHPGGSDRPDPHPPPDPRRPRGARRATEPPIDACPREPGHGTRPTPVRRHHDLRVRTAPPTPRDHAGTFGLRGGPTAAAPRSPPASAGPGSPARTVGRTARAAHRRGGGRAVDVHPRGRRSRRNLDRPRLTFVSRTASGGQNSGVGGCGGYFRADSGMRNAPPVLVAATRNPLLMTRSKMVLSPRPVFSSAHVSPLVFE
jgi:hypothetical protein